MPHGAAGWLKFATASWFKNATSLPGRAHKVHTFDKHPTVEDVIHPPRSIIEYAAIAPLRLAKTLLNITISLLKIDRL